MSAKAVLLINLGSPDSTSVKDVRRYLRQFLTDERVIDIPAFFRHLLVNLLILPFRPRKTAEAYKKIWTPEGSPLLVYTKKLAELLFSKTGIRTEFAMRYGNPSIYNVLAGLKSANIENILVIPLYPHYAMSSYETAVEELNRALKGLSYSPEIVVLPPFYSDSFYISALADSYKRAISAPPQHLLFSYHGLPERHIKKSDVTGNHCLVRENCCEVGSPAHLRCYRHQVFTTSRLLAQKVGIDQSGYTVAFQSRLGRDPWLLPNTETILAEFPKRGITNLAVISPSFVSDNLETLEEINIRYRELFLASGGKSFTYIPALNTSPAFVDTLAKFCSQL